MNPLSFALQQGRPEGWGCVPNLLDGNHDCEPVSGLGQSFAAKPRPHDNGRQSQAPTGNDHCFRTTVTVVKGQTKHLAVFVVK